MSEWKETTLGEIVNLKTGKLNSNAAVNNGKYPFFTCSPETFKIDNYAFDCEAVLLAGNNANGIYSIKFYHGKFNAYQRTYVITAKNAFISHLKFIYYLLSLKLNYFKDISQGSATKFLTVEILGNLFIKIPPIQEQKQIADVLSCLDRKIDNLRRQNETLEKIAQTLFKHWFIDFEFPNDDGKPYKSSGGAMVTSELGDIPEGWRVGKLGDMALFKNGKTPPERSEQFSIPIYGSNGVIGKTNTYNNQNVIVIGRVGSYCGSLYYFLEKCWVTDNAMTGKLNGFSSHAFLYFILKISNLNKRSTGSGQPLLNQEILSSIELPMADNILIKNFESIVKPMFKKMLDNSNQIQTLTKTRDTLLPKLMSGEIRVKEAESIIEEQGK